MEKRSETRKVVLIPWDPNSSEHRERLYEQRIACGWKADMVEKWQGLQRNGKMAIQWVVLSDEDPERDSKLALHILQFPVEKESILDSATTFGGLPRMLPNSPRSFIPVGHISLDSERYYLRTSRLRPSCRVRVVGARVGAPVGSGLGV
ncbi:hypothetical protein V1506DRAFT_241587, partial [Lipomyces tetrasporus]